MLSAASKSRVGTCFFRKQARLWRNSTWSGDTLIVVADLTRMNSFFTIVFASFVEAQDDFTLSFSGWLKVLFSQCAFRIAHFRSVICRQGRRFTSGPPTAHSHTPLISLTFQPNLIFTPVPWYPLKHLLTSP
jgi:hypothetical protein